MGAHGLPVSHLLGVTHRGFAKVKYELALANQCRLIKQLSRKEKKKQRRKVDLVFILFSLYSVIEISNK